MHRRVLAAVVALVAAGMVVGDASATPYQGPVDLGSDMAPVDNAEIPASELPAGLDGGDTRAAGLVDPIQPGDGWTAWPGGTGVRNYGPYRIQLVDGTPEQVRGWVQSVAAQLTALTNIPYVVEPGFVARPPGYATELFATAPSDSSTWGFIRVLMFDNQSPCGPLAFLPSGTVGCGGPDSVSAGGSRAYVRGSVWLATGLQLGSASLQAETTAHEIGHAVGLAHHEPDYQGVRQLMYPVVSSSPPPGSCGTHYRAGDRNGVWYTLNPFAWLVTAQYRDFLGRFADPDGYDFWLRSGATANSLAVSLSSSPEWVGHVVDELYFGFRGGPPESAAARNFWSDLIRQIGVARVAAELYGSDEYFNRNGANVDDWIRALYRDLLGAGRIPSATDLSYWRTTTAQVGRSVVAFAIYQSIENRRSRVDRLYVQLLDRGADEAGRAFWADQIERFGDLALAIFLASSAEYQDNADSFALAPPSCTG
jgi:hypothetical protein